VSKLPSSSEIRRQFIDYFVEKCGHTFVPSSPCVPLDDPTLMFTNAGMNQFKDVFLATGTRPYTRAANTQKCIRAGGKHNDLDDVGHDTYHHTFFEMLGNWSFGDYFKKEAISWAWDLLTRVWGMDQSRLHATYFAGDAAEGLEPDREAAELWRTATDIDPAHIHPGKKKDNFWEMGETGPCGPCSEIHIDLTPDKSGSGLVNAGDARVIEIWNLVFIQFNRDAGGKLTPLPAKHVDTGMGFERLCAVLQGVHGNYETDIFAAIFEAIRRRTKAPDYTGTLEPASNDTSPQRKQGSDPQIMIDVTYRVIADHLRCLTFALTDGAMPDNEGRGYVLRRILRRAVRYGRQYLDMHEPFICHLVPAVVETMGEAFPELRTAHGGKNAERVAAIIREEEQSFIKTLDRGIALFEEAADFAVKNHHGRISGEDAFKLHDTYGFPIDLTELMAQERGLSVNIGEYERMMEQARERARGSKQITKIVGATLSPAQITSGRAVALPAATDDSPKYTEGTITAMLRAIARLDEHGQFEIISRRDTARVADHVGLVFDRTCFYSEAGGQVADRGTIAGQNARFEVENTQRYGNYVIHWGTIVVGELRTNESYELTVDASRARTMKNHTVTHMMNWALREVLGEHVQQKGSLVDPDKTRFDLSHHAQITEEQLARVEESVNRLIAEDKPVYTQVVEKNRALEINTLRAVFGEQYPDNVRVVSIGVPVEELLKNPKNPEWMKHSVEFCGGTHLKRTGEAGKFRLIEESAVAKGVRRVVGVTGARAQQAEADATAIYRLLKQASEANDEALPNRIAEITALMSQTELPVVDKARLRDDLAKLQDRAKKIQKQVAKAGAADVMTRVDELLAAAQRVGGAAVIAADLGEATIDQLRAACDSLRDRAGSAAMLLAARNEGKVLLLAAMTKDVIARGVKAGDLIKEIAPIIGGKGGGRPDMAQGGGNDVEKIPDCLIAAAAWVRGKLA
jgi:alanyl-tRNA synthetase